MKFTSKDNIKPDYIVLIEQLKVDFDIGVICDVLNPENLFCWGFWIKHICDCLYGEDLSVKFPRMKPNKKM
ncbi:hypothetical protein [Clostridium sp. LP20]|uniref:hypothetical protein n=1 Tax=Clostridium sp. LP20 TaxID=3418665 RepID=UPI003EE5CD97